MAEEKKQRQKEAEEMPFIRKGILTGLLIDIADVFNVPLETIQSGDQQELTVFIRSVFYYVARLKTEYGLQSLAETAGRINHAGCIHHIRKVKSFFKVQNPVFMSLWRHYLTNSKLFTSKDFTHGQN
jgi:chromosomal replication initiation ATPase DnaA